MCVQVYLEIPNSEELAEALHSKVCMHVFVCEPVYALHLQYSNPQDYF